MSNRHEQRLFPLTCIVWYTTSLQACKLSSPTRNFSPARPFIYSSWRVNSSHPVQYHLRLFPFFSFFFCSYAQFFVSSPIIRQGATGYLLVIFFSRYKRFVITFQICFHVCSQIQLATEAWFIRRWSFSSNRWIIDDESRYRDHGEFLLRVFSKHLWKTELRNGWKKILVRVCIWWSRVPYNTV